MSDKKDKRSRKGCHHALDSDWDEMLDFLCGELLASKNSSVAREHFYSQYQKVCRAVALRILSDWKWKGDIAYDAEEIASESVKILLLQESQGRGVFHLDLNGQYRGYLSRTIWRSCVQIAMRMQPRIAFDSLDQLLLQGMEFSATGGRPPQELHAELMEILCLLEAVRGDYPKIPAHLHPLECVLSGEIGDSELEGIKRRTLQRYAKRIRNLLIRHFRVPREGRESH
jgi:hypothetical protein